MGKAGNEVKEKEKKYSPSALVSITVHYQSLPTHLSCHDLYTYLEISKKEVTNYVDNV